MSSRFRMCFHRIPASHVNGTAHGSKATSELPKLQGKRKHQVPAAPSSSSLSLPPRPSAQAAFLLTQWCSSLFSWSSVLTSASFTVTFCILTVLPCSVIFIPFPCAPGSASVSFGSLFGQGCWLLFSLFHFLTFRTTVSLQTGQFFKDVWVPTPFANHRFPIVSKGLPLWFSNHASWSPEVQRMCLTIAEAAPSRPSLRPTTSTSTFYFLKMNSTF